MYFENGRAPLGDAELDALHELLELRAVPFRGMSLEMLDGFLCALAVGTEPVPEDEWLPKVWGPRPPRWESRDDADRVRAQLLALRDEVLRRVAVEPDASGTFEAPLIALPDPDSDPEFDAANAANADDDAAVGSEWANGFLDGIELRDEAWDALATSEQWIDEALWCVEAIALGEWPAPEGKPSEGRLSEEERGELIAGIPQMLHDLFMHRFEQGVSRTPIRKAAEPGRNDPCPCGSGRKYKKCCAADATLH